MKNKGIPFPNLGAYILLDAPTLGANNLFHKEICYPYKTNLWSYIKDGLNCETQYMCSYKRKEELYL